MWLTTKEYRKKYNISPQCLYEMKKHGRIQIKELGNGKYLVYDKVEDKKIAIYARVSTAKHEKDLENQIDYIKKHCIEKGDDSIVVFQDIASGMNENRKGLNDMITAILNSKISKVVVLNKDRLTRFGYKYFQNLFIRYDVEIEVVNSEDEKNDTFYDELTEDLTSIIHYFSARLYGQRKNNRKQIEANAISLEPNEDN